MILRLVAPRGASTSNFVSCMSQENVFQCGLLFSQVCRLHAVLRQSAGYPDEQRASTPYLYLSIALSRDSRHTRQLLQRGGIEAAIAAECHTCTAFQPRDERSWCVLRHYAALIDNCHTVT